MPQDHGAVTRSQRARKEMRFTPEDVDRVTHFDEAAIDPTSRLRRRSLATTIAPSVKETIAAGDDEEEVENLTFRDYMAHIGNHIPDFRFTEDMVDLFNNLF